MIQKSKITCFSILLIVRFLRSLQPRLSPQNQCRISFLQHLHNNVIDMIVVLDAQVSFWESRHTRSTGSSTLPTLPPLPPTVNLSCEAGCSAREAGVSKTHGTYLEMRLIESGNTRGTETCQHIQLGGAGTRPVPVSGWLRVQRLEQSMTLWHSKIFGVRHSWWSEGSHAVRKDNESSPSLRLLQPS